MSDMTPIRAPRGAVSVGRLMDLDPLEAGAVLYMRLCWTNPDALGLLERDFVPLLGLSAGQSAARCFLQMASLCQSHGRRPLRPHSQTCACLGGDEACFARLLASAAEGAREDALMMALLLVRADFAPVLAALAQDAGLALHRMTLRAGETASRPDTSAARAAGTTLH
jgi:hypothetical protein